MTAEDTQHPDLQRLRRWVDSGGTWSVAARRVADAEDGGEEVIVSLLTCDGGEEMDVLSSADPELLAYVQSGESAAR